MYLLSWRDEFASQYENMVIALAGISINIFLRFLIALLKAITKLIVPVNNQLEVFTEEIKKVVTGAKTASKVISQSRSRLRSSDRADKIITAAMKELNRRIFTTLFSTSAPTKLLVILK